MSRTSSSQTAFDDTEQRIGENHLARGHALTSGKKLASNVVRTRKPTNDSGTLLRVLPPRNGAPTGSASGKAETSSGAVSAKFDVGQAPTSNAQQHKPLQRVFYDRVRNILDVLTSLLLILLAAPLFLIIAIAVRASSPGPIIFRQRRLTKDGREFTMYKFRSMCCDAEAKSGATFAAKSDPRITRLGAILRMTRLDELPQLFNVLKGEMSIIGPRPERPEIATDLSEKIVGFHRRLDVKAGLTGLAQIGNGYAACTESHRKKLAWDRLYIQKRSFLLDLSILIRTVWVVFTRRGAR